jgi:hypothetical protein
MALPKLYPHNDPLGEWEHDNVEYTLIVYVPKRIPNRYKRWILKRSHPLDLSDYDPKYSHKLGGNPKFESWKPPSYTLNKSHLPGMKKKTVRIKSWRFPEDMRCSHVTGENRGRKCENGCYIIEHEGKRGSWGSELKCGRPDCNGHRWKGYSKKDKNGVSCFGKGQRLVCIESTENST